MSGGDWQLATCNMQHATCDDVIRSTLVKAVSQQQRGEKKGIEMMPKLDCCT